MKNLEAHETEAVVDGSASVHIPGLPFVPGERLRVLLLKGQGAEPGVLQAVRHTLEEIRRSKALRQGLKGTVIHYEGHDEPVGSEDWEALRDEGPNP